MGSASSSSSSELEEACVKEVPQPYYTVNEEYSSNEAEEVPQPYLTVREEESSNDAQEVPQPYDRTKRQR